MVYSAAGIAGEGREGTKGRRQWALAAHVLVLQGRDGGRRKSPIDSSDSRLVQ